jgi:Fe-S oxidoreductase
MGQRLKLEDFTKEKVEVIYHVGCQTSFYPEVWKLAQGTARVLQKAGVNLVIGGSGRSAAADGISMGYKQDFLDQAKKNMDLFKQVRERKS